MLSEPTARTFVRMTMPNLTRRWPYKLDQVLNGPEDAAEPAAIHPIFHGSFEWHSCVHGYWQVLRLLRLFPDMPEAADIRVLANAMLVPAKVAGEVARLDRPFGASFERPYGWAWLLALHAEAARHDAPWAAALEPLALRFAAQFREFLPKLTYPITVGTHFNTAFALVLRRTSLRQDVDGGTRATMRSRVLSGAFLVVLAITITTASVDWLMSIDPHFASTLYGWYVFAGVFERADQAIREHLRAIGAGLRRCLQCRCVSGARPRRLQCRRVSALRSRRRSLQRAGRGLGDLRTQGLDRCVRISSWCDLRRRAQHS